MTTLKARFDGRVRVPEQPVDLPQDCVLEIQIADAEPQVLAATADALEAAPSEAPPLDGLLKLLSQLPDDSDTPTDLAAQHGRYLHGMPNGIIVKRMSSKF